MSSQLQRTALIVVLTLVATLLGVRALLGGDDSDSALATGCDQSGVAPVEGTLRLEFLGESSIANVGMNDYRLSGTVRWDSQAALDCYTEDVIDWAYEHEVSFVGDFDGRVWNSDHDFPDDADFYLDTSANDREGETVLAVGLFRPERLIADREYGFSFDTMLPRQPSDARHSFTLDGEVAEKTCGTVGAWCLNRTRALASSTVALIDEGYDFGVETGGCWHWDGGEPTPCDDQPAADADDEQARTGGEDSGDGAESASPLVPALTDVAPAESPFAEPDDGTEGGGDSAAGDQGDGASSGATQPSDTPDPEPTTTVAASRTPSQTPAPTTTVASSPGTTTAPRATPTTAPPTSTVPSPTTTLGPPAPTTAPPTTPTTTVPPGTTTVPPGTTTTAPPTTAPPTTTPPVTPPTITGFSADGAGGDRIRARTSISWPDGALIRNCSLFINGTRVDNRDCGDRYNVNVRGLAPGTYNVQARACYFVVLCANSPTATVTLGPPPTTAPPTTTTTLAPTTTAAPTTTTLAPTTTATTAAATTTAATTTTLDEGDG